MSDCNCEKSDMVEDWPDERDVGDRFLRMDETPLITSIRDNIIRADVNQNAIFNRKMDEDRLDDLDLENVIIDYSFAEKEDETLIDYDVPSDAEEETVNYEEEANGEMEDKEPESGGEMEDKEPESEEEMEDKEPESEDDIEGEMEEIDQKEVEIQNPEVLETKINMSSKNKVSDYLDDFL
jgi:hypothetical protein